tara:strand:- start:171 stop:353 length:183 start_codon:yes stop_codon:yes gene_type:complete
MGISAGSIKHDKTQGSFETFTDEEEGSSEEESESSEESDTSEDDESSEDDFDERGEDNVE